MSSTKHQRESSIQETSLMIKLIEETVVAQSFEKLAEHLLPSIIGMMRLRSAFLYMEDSHLHTFHYFGHGLQPESDNETKKLCAEQLGRHSNQADLQLTSIQSSVGKETTSDIMFYALRDEGTCTGLIGLVPEEQTTFTLPNYWEQILRVTANTISRLAKREETERRLAYLNAYKTVSSMLAQELCLHDLLEAALYCCMEVVSAEAASILLLDDEKRNLKFYQTEGPAKLTLMTETFPVDKGIAGSILQKHCSEVINDVHVDPRFYGTIDNESGFHTRNMIAVPLVAGEEQIGVLEVLNKVNGGSFTEEERLLLSSIAEEIAFAIRNAKVFDYVVNSYCKQRQGNSSCKGCKRPLGSWTPCVKYRYSEV